jgi:hypothetical protein
MHEAFAYLDSKVPGRYLELSIIEIGGSSSAPPNKNVQNVAIIEKERQASSYIPGQVKTWYVPARTVFGGWGARRRTSSGLDTHCSLCWRPGLVGAFLVGSIDFRDRHS